jgi:peptidyl-prolyl cis-trans isomerase A (cyclophilin A)
MEQFGYFLLVMMVMGIGTGMAEAGEKKGPAPGLYAIMETSLGVMTIQLFEKEAPKTVENFVSLAEGTREWLDPTTHKKVKRPLYDGLIFHRVIPGFMIQGGDPMGSGMGGPGYEFGDEFASGLQFDRAGRLAMANAGPNTNGSQFFITEGPTPHLNNHHTIFGQIISGQDVSNKIANTPRDRMDRPREAVVLKKVQINRVK